MKKRFGKHHDLIVLSIMFWTAIGVGLLMAYITNQNMCSSGAHYIDWEELEELERVHKEETEGTPKKYICSYSGLPSLLIYEDDKIIR